MVQSAAISAQKSLTQQQNRAAIMEAALDAFSTYGFRGTTVDQIAQRCGMSKPNLLYYFKSKEEMYTAVLQQTLDDWLKPLRMLDVNGDPIQELTRYISEKLEMSERNPKASKLFANEILHGAPNIGEFLRGALRDRVEEKSAVIRRWAAEGKIRPVDPQHFIFAIWAVTQHYADFSVQVDAILGSEQKPMRTRQAVLDILLRGLTPSGDVFDKEWSNTKDEEAYKEL